MILPQFRVSLDPDQFKAAYVQDYEWGQVICSPLRPENNPSWAMYRRESNVFWKDFASGDEGDAVDFVRALTNVSQYTAELKLSSFKTEYQPNIHVTKPSEKIITWVERGWNVDDRDYWLGRYQIPFEILEDYNVSPAQAVFVNGEFRTKGGLIYIYKQGRKVRVYMPDRDKKFKWLSAGSFIFGIDQLNWIGDVLVITKSLKDVMAYRTLGIDAIAPSSESTLIDSVTMEQLKRRFPRILVNFDNDDAGRKGSKMYVDTYGLQEFYVPKEKDLTDWRYIHKPSIEEQCAMIMI